MQRFFSAHHRFIKDRDFEGAHASIEELLILPFLKNQDYKHNFVSKWSVKAKEHAKNGDLSHELVTALYLSDAS